MPTYQDYSDDDDDDDTNVNNIDMTNLDPSVAALLQSSVDDVPINDLRVRIALMKMQQARVRGNSDYAAKIMDHAIEEGAKDRQAWNLLDARIRKIESIISTTNTTNSVQEETATTTAATTEEDNNNKSNTDDDNNANKDDDETTTSSNDTEQVKQLKQQIIDLENHKNSVEQLLEKRMMEEIESIKTEQQSIRQREDQLRSKIRSLQLSIKEMANNNNNKTTNTNSTNTVKQLQQAMKDAYDYTFLLNAECTVCHENTATKAIIPCGHLALCDECTKTITQLEPSQRQCPLCRGNLLSTLHIYTTK